MNYLCLYHADCADGFGAALAVHLYCTEHGYTCDFIPVQYGQDPPDVTGQYVFVVDFSYPRAVLLEMHQRAADLVVVDHHKTAQADLADLDFCLFDMDISGAVLTWKYLLPTDLPLLFRYLQDRDLWQWKLTESREVSAALRSYPMDFQVWTNFLSQDAINTLREEGRAILRYQQRAIETAVKKAHEMEFDGFHVLCLNATNYISEIGNALCQGRPFSITYFDTADKRVYSLRSDEQGVDVSTIAKQHGGGGHPHAAGFTTKL